MKSGNNISEELVSMGSDLPHVSAPMPFAVPPEYFETFPLALNEIIRVSQIDDPRVLMPKINPMVVPKAYFEALPERMLHLAAANEINSVAGHKMPFAVPGSYFDNLPVRMLDAAKHSEGNVAKIIALGRAWHQVRLAAAAVLLLSIGFGSMKYYLNQPAHNTSLALAQVPTSAINEYVMQNIDDFDQDLIYNNAGVITPLKPEQLNNAEITQYLDETGWNVN